MPAIQGIVNAPAAGIPAADRLQMLSRIPESVRSLYQKRRKRGREKRETGELLRKRKAEQGLLYFALARDALSRF